MYIRLSGSLDATLAQSALERLVQCVLASGRRGLIQANSSIDKSLSGSHLFEN